MDYKIFERHFGINYTWTTLPILTNPDNKFCPECLRDVSDIYRNRSNRHRKKSTCPVCSETYKKLMNKEEIRELRLKKLLRS